MHVAAMIKLELASQTHKAKVTEFMGMIIL